MSVIYANYIAKNEEEYLPYSITSIKDAVDGIILVDNGSTDNTIEVAKNAYPDIQIISAPDEKDFSVLRNLALDQTPVGSWVFKLDADEVFYPSINNLRVCLEVFEPTPQIVGLKCFYEHLLRDPWHSHHEQEKHPLFHRVFLFRYTQGLRWIGSVHERVDLKGISVETDFRYVHYGYAKAQRKVFERWELYAKLDRNIPDDIYEGRDPDTILDDRPAFPFERGHPPVIAEYLEKAYPKEKRI